MRLFGPLAEAAGAVLLPLDLPLAATAEAAVAALVARVPALAPRLDASVRFAVGVEYVPADRPLAEGETLCLLPPVGGG